MMLDAFKRPNPNIYYYRYECFFLLFWFLWALSFFYKAVDEVESLKSIIYLLVHILGFLEVLWAANKASNPQHAIKYGWLTFIALSIPLAIYELITDFHLAMSVQDTGNTMLLNGVRLERPFASVTFGNLNSYNTVLCWALPSLFMCNLHPRNKKDYVIGYILLAFTALIIIANASRGAIMCLALMLTTYVYAYYKTGRNRFGLTVVLALSLGTLVYYLGDLFILIIERFSDQGVSDDGRSENLSVGFQAFLNSYGLGIGVGNYEPIMGNVYRIEVPAPHNLLLEVLVCFGLPVILGFIGMYVHIARICLREGSAYNRDMLLFCTTALLFAGIIDSTYLMKATTWMFIASTYIYLDPRYNSDRIKVLTQNQ